ncbi:Solute carrier family 35 member F1 [Taenia crassiceps]|uniref:Solute carrier family 35 member F1 n=1 Tax=Taenia crassiceps TaxID=6207 RepID=A0ABR4Q9M3_9CEST
MFSGVLKKTSQVDQLPTDGEVSLRRTASQGGDIDSLSSYSDGSISISTPTVRSRILHHSERLLLPLALGQFLSALIAATGIASNYLVHFGVSLPLAQNLPHYFLLAIAYGIFSWRRLLSDPIESTLSRSQNFWYFLRSRGWQYFVAGTIDMHANWAIVSAYSYTNLTSVQLLDCLTIPTAMILSRFCLKTRYTCVHTIGVITCLIGAGAMVGADYLAAKAVDTGIDTITTDDTLQTSSVILGDFLVIAGAVGYGASNVYQEYLVRKFGVIDYLSFSALAGILWTAIYCISLEYKKIDSELNHLSANPNLAASLGCLVGYAAAMFLLYTVLPFALSKTNSVLVNLSLLTADLYALLIGIYLFGNSFHPLYLASFGAIMLGLCLFASKDPILRSTAEVPPTCIDRDGYFAGRCMFYSGGSACSFALAVTSLGLIFCLIYMTIDVGFLSLPQKYRRHITIFELGFSGFWTFVFFVLFSYMADHWRISDAAKEDLSLISLNNVRASIAFAFFSIFSWGGMTYAAYKRYISIQNYNQYADDVAETSHDPHGGEAVSGYIDYFNRPPGVQAGFDASATMDDEHRAGDTELLTS